MAFDRLNSQTLPVSTNTRIHQTGPRFDSTLALSVAWKIMVHQSSLYPLPLLLIVLLACLSPTVVRAMLVRLVYIVYFHGITAHVIWVRRL